MEGRDFTIAFDGKPEIGGFYTTRFVKAKNPDDAELKAVDLIKQDKSFHEISLNSEPIKPTIYLEEIAEISWFKYIVNKLGKGYTFYKGDGS